MLQCYIQWIKRTCCQKQVFLRDERTSQPKFWGRLRITTAQGSLFGAWLKINHPQSLVKLTQAVVVRSPGVTILPWNKNFNKQLVFKLETERRWQWEPQEHFNEFGFEVRYHNYDWGTGRPNKNDCSTKQIDTGLFITTSHAKKIMSWRCIVITIRLVFRAVTKYD